MSVDVFVTILFRFLNGAVLIGLGYYLFKRYVKNRIDEKINQKEVLLKGLEEQGYFLEGKMHDLQEQFEQQAQKIVDLKEKINEWNIQVAGEQIKKQEEYKLNLIRAGHHIAIKNEHIAQQYQRTQIMSQVLEQAHQALQEEFSNPAAARAYTHSILEHLERK